MSLVYECIGGRRDSLVLALIIIDSAAALVISSPHFKGTPVRHRTDFQYSSQFVLAGFYTYHFHPRRSEEATINLNRVKPYAESFSVVKDVAEFHRHLDGY